MYLTKEKTQEIFKKYGGSEKNTGSTEGQISLITYRISHISKYLKENKKDFSALRSLGILVSRRKKLLKYLSHNAIERYRKIIKDLELRK